MPTYKWRERCRIVIWVLNTPDDFPSLSVVWKYRDYILDLLMCISNYDFRWDISKDCYVSQMR